MPAEPSALDIDAIYRRHGGLVYRRILRFFPPERAESLLQDVFVRVIASQASFRGESSVTTWLYQVTTRYCLNQLRNERRRDELLEEHGDLEWGLPVSQPQQETRTFLKQLWQHLDPELVEVGIYYFVDDLSQAEIARIMGCSRRTIGNRIQRLVTEARSHADADAD